MTEELERLLEVLRALSKAERRASSLLEHPDFESLVALLAPRDDGDLMDLARGDDTLLACAAFEALARRDGDAGTLMLLVPGARGQRAVFLLRALDRRIGEGLVTRLILAAGDGWLKAPLKDLRELVRRRDEEVTLGEIPHARLDTVAALVNGLGDAVPAALGTELERRRAARDSAAELRDIGRVWRDDLQPQLVMDAQFTRELDTLEAAVTADPTRPVLVIGESGTGRTARLQALGARLVAQGWAILEAGGGEVNAGQSYIGELEGRMQRLIGTLEGKPILWIVPRFDELLWNGTHRFSRTGILGMLLRGLERTQIHIAGEIDPAGYERLLRERPAVRSAFEPLRIEPASEEASLALARKFAPPEVAKEALALAKQFLPGALPGSVLSLLDATRRRAGETYSIEDVLATVAERSGMPLPMLDERERLDVDALRRFFLSRVVGQPEAVECVVERVALVKVGLTDPTRPLAVLLFVGPTGTGKTEIAKALAEYLFGSPDRMVRVDMSEYQNPGSARRMLGEAEGEDSSLVGAIRRQPFSVVLLDEFEKADPGVWDLFLQVFDDGRLSDPRGQPADFRHAVIIMTSNLGARIPTGSGIGFSPATGFAAGSVSQAVERAFRREFLNRIDRIVVFRPLSRPVMREILNSELEAVLARRGLRGRDWAVEFDDSAVEFLLSEGFTPDLGARPLKRAVERHFLTPLALAIAGHDYPGGDQFLFVRAGGEGLRVTWIDPDAPEVVPEAAPAGATLRTLAREGGPGSELLQEAFQSVSERVDSDAWDATKAELLARMGEPGFWEDDGRLAVLSAIELRDRIEAGLRSASSLLGRIRGARRPPASLVRRAAQRLLLLREALDALEADEPADARLRVEGDPEFGPRVADMYRRWARERGMRLEVTEERAGRRFRLAATVSGFAALRTLAPESGFHVLEVPDGRGGYDRRRVRVTVTPDVAGLEEPSERQEIVRRYRERPTPLVRDAVRGWRTGRLDAVLAGGFDLVE